MRGDTRNFPCRPARVSSLEPRSEHLLGNLALEHRSLRKFGGIGRRGTAAWNYPQISRIYLASYSEKS